MQGAGEVQSSRKAAAKTLINVLLEGFTAPPANLPNRPLVGLDPGDP
jgi:hypothetical protein